MRGKDGKGAGARRRGGLAMVAAGCVASAAWGADAPVAGDIRSTSWILGAGVVGIVAGGVGVGALLWARLRREHQRVEDCRIALDATRSGMWERELGEGEDAPVLLNERARELLGVASGSEVTLRMLLDRLHPDFREVVSEAIRRAETATGRYDVEYLLAAGPEGYKWFRSRAVVVRKHGRPVRVVGSLSDISEERAAQAALRERDEQARQALRLEAVGRLAGGVAHDFNNLLTAIRGYTSLATATLPEGHEALESLGRVEEAAQQATGVAAALLTFSRRADGVRARIPLVRPIGSAARLFQKLAPREVTVVTDFRGIEDVMVEADETQMQQVLMNLCLNAKDAVGERGRIEIVATRERQDGSEQARVSVRDDGVGMSPDVRARAFEPYFTTKHASTGGGMGLSVVHGIIREHGGRVEVESTPGKGSVFSVVLPVAGGGEAGPAEEKGSVSQGDAIVLDHNEMVRAVLTSMLERLGYGVISGETAAGLLEAQGEGPWAGRVTLVVAKNPLVRPGWEALSSRIPASAARVAVCGREESEDDARRWGAVALRKPFQLSDLWAAIAAARRERSGAS